MKLPSGAHVAVIDGERFVLAQAAWLRQEKSGGLIAGIRVLPGIPQAIAALEGLGPVLLEPHASWMTRLVEEWAKRYTK